MADKPVPNIYLLLDLDPNKPWNETEFQSQLQKKRQEWSRLINIPNQKGVQAKQNLGLLQKIQEIAADPESRKAQAADALKAKKNAETTEVKRFEERLDLLQLKGHILEGELSLLLKDFGSTLSEPEIRKRLRVPIQKEDATRQKRATIEPSVAKTIAVKLASLGKTDLYDLLGVGPADNTVLRQRADELYAGVQKKGVKTADDTTTAELCGNCLTIFSSNEDRAKYDESLRLQVYEDLKAKVELSGQVSKWVDAKQIEQLLRQARQQRLDLDEAWSIIREHAGKRGISIGLPENLVGGIKALQRCGYCNWLNEQDKKRCGNCGQPLFSPCPRCGKPVPSDAMACSACGFQVSNRLYVLMLLGEAEEASGKRDWDTAGNLVGQAKANWLATATDDLGKRIQKLETQTAAEKTRRDELVRDIENAIDSKRFYQARKLLGQVEPLLTRESGLPARFNSQIGPKIEQAEKLLKQANQSRTSDPESAIRTYRDVLGICQDCEEARQNLAKTPPKPPTLLKAVAGGNIVHLTWEPSPSYGVRYRVVRKERSQPVAANDGLVIATVDGALYDDKTAEIGLSTYYGIYADREGTTSADAATLATPVLLIQDVSHVTAQVSDSQVHLHWQPPPNIYEVLIRRGETNYPGRINEGVEVRPLDSKQAVDRPLENNHRYFYTIYCQFVDHTGGFQLTPGTQIEATPQHPPEPIQEVSLAESGPFDARQVVLEWVPPLKGEAVVVKSRQPSALKFAQVISQQDLPRYGEVLASRDNQVRDQVNRLGFYYYLPVVLFEGHAYVGNEKRYVCVEDVSQLSVQNLGYALRLQWNWPQDCEEVLVTYGYQGWVKPYAAEGNTTTLTRAQYNLRGYFDILNPVKENHYITVFATVSQDEQKIIAAGENPAARKLVYLGNRIAVSYEIKKARFGNKFELQLTVDGEGTLPALVLTAKQTALPMARSEGETILRVESAPIQKRQWTVALPQSVTKRQMYARLFLEKDELYDAVAIRHPDREKLRLF